MITRGFGVGGVGIGGTVFVDGITATVEADPSVVLEPSDFVVILEDEPTAEISDLVLLEPEMEWIWFDTFTTDQASPLGATRFCEPGPGQWLWRNTTEPDACQISDGAMEWMNPVGPGTQIWATNGLFNANEPAPFGTTLYQHFNIGEGQGVVAFFFGLPFENWTALSEGVRIRYNRIDQIGGRWNFVAIGGSTLTDFTDYRLGVIARPRGAYYILDGKLVEVSQRWINDGMYAAWGCVWDGVDVGVTTDYHRTLETGVANITDREGFDEWGGDFTEYTDEKTAPANNTVFLHEANFHYHVTFTFETTKNFYTFFRKVGTQNGFQFLALGSTGQLNVGYNDGVYHSFGSKSGLFFDGINYKIDVVALGSSIQIYVDSVLIFDVVSTHLETQENGSVSHSLVTNDIDLETHPHTKLGVATDRLICPNHTSPAPLGPTMESEDDAIFVIHNVQLPPSASCYVYHRTITKSTDDLNLRIQSDGSMQIEEYIGGVKNVLVSVGAGSVSNGDDIHVQFRGSFGYFRFGNEFSAFGAYSTNAITKLSGGTSFINGWTNYNDARADDIQVFPVNVQNRLPEVLGGTR